MAFAARRSLGGSDRGAVLGGASACRRSADGVLNQRALCGGPKRHCPGRHGPVSDDSLGDHSIGHGARSDDAFGHDSIGHGSWSDDAFSHDPIGHGSRSDDALFHQAVARHTTGGRDHEGKPSGRRGTESDVGRPEASARLPSTDTAGGERSIAKTRTARRTRARSHEQRRCHLDDAGRVIDRVWTLGVTPNASWGRHLGYPRDLAPGERGEERE